MRSIPALLLSVILLHAGSPARAEVTSLEPGACLAGELPPEQLVAFLLAPFDFESTFASIQRVAVMELARSEALPSRELERAERLLQERFQASDDSGRAARLLARRGFDEETVRSAIEHHFELSDA